MAKNSPAATSSDTLSTARTRPSSKLLPTCANAISGGVGIQSGLVLAALTLPWRERVKRSTTTSLHRVELILRKR